MDFNRANRKTTLKQRATNREEECGDDHKCRWKSLIWRLIWTTHHPRNVPWGSRASPAFEQHSVHGKAQHCKHCGPDTRSQPEGGVPQVRLAHVSVQQEEATHRGRQAESVWNGLGGSRWMSLKRENSNSNGCSIQQKQHEKMIIRETKTETDGALIKWRS